DRHEQDVEVTGGPALSEDLVVQVDVGDVERDVLLRFPADRLRQFLVALDRKRDLLDDHRVARDRRGHTLVLDVLLVEDPVDRIRDRQLGNDHAVDDAVGGKWFHSKAYQLVPRLAGTYFGCLDVAGPDVQAYYFFARGEEVEIHEGSKHR